MSAKKNQKSESAVSLELDEFITLLERLRIPYSKTQGHLGRSSRDKAYTTVSVSQAHFIFNSGKFESVDDDELGYSRKRVPEGQPCNTDK